MKTPKIIIAMPNYNGARYLADSIQSVLVQTYRDFSLIVVDNCSTDDSLNIIESFRDERIILHRNEKHQNITQNFNTCARLGESADYCCIMHADDLYEETYLETMLATMEENPDVLMAHCDFKVIDEKSLIQENYKFNLKRRFLKSPDGACLKRSSEEELNLLIRGDYIICPSVMYRGEAFKLVGYFNEAYRLVEDWDFFLRVLLAGQKIIYVPQKLFNYRVHPENMTAYNQKHLIKYSEHLQMLGKVIEEARKRNIKIEYDVNSIEANTLKILMWDLKEDLLSGYKEEAKKKYDFALINISSFRSYSKSLVVFQLIKMGRIGGLILDIIAKSYFLIKKSRF